MENLEINSDLFSPDYNEWRENGCRNAEKIIENIKENNNTDTALK